MVGVRHGNAPIMNQHAGPRWHKKQPYRTIVVIGGDVSMPPVCFFTTAIRALRGDPLERVLFFVDSHARPLVDSVINVLETWTYPIPPNAPSNPLAEVRLLNSSDNTLLHGVLAAAHVLLRAGGAVLARCNSAERSLSTQCSRSSEAAGRRDSRWPNVS